MVENRYFDIISVVYHSADKKNTDKLLIMVEFTENGS